eukprot:UC1_evm3s1206
MAASAEEWSWVSAIDPDSGDTYYINEATSESSWDKPEGWDEIMGDAKPVGVYEPEPEGEAIPLYEPASYHEDEEGVKPEEGEESSMGEYIQVEEAEVIVGADTEGKEEEEEEAGTVVEAEEVVLEHSTETADPPAVAPKPRPKPGPLPLPKPKSKPVLTRPQEPQEQQQQGFASKLEAATPTAMEPPVTAPRRSSVIHAPLPMPKPKARPKIVPRLPQPTPVESGPERIQQEEEEEQAVRSASAAPRPNVADRQRYVDRPKPTVAPKPGLAPKPKPFVRKIAPPSGRRNLVDKPSTPKKPSSLRRESAPVTGDDLPDATTTSKPEPFTAAAAAGAVVSSSSSDSITANDTANDAAPKDENEPEHMVVVPPLQPRWDPVKNGIRLSTVSSEPESPLPQQTSTKAEHAEAAEEEDVFDEKLEEEEEAAAATAIATQRPATTLRAKPKASKAPQFSYTGASASSLLSRNDVASRLLRRQRNKAGLKADSAKSLYFSKRIRKKRENLLSERNTVYREDLGEWLGLLFGEEPIPEDQLLERISSGVLMCRLADLIQEGLKDWKYKPTLPFDKIRPPKYRKNVSSSQKFLAMDNVSNFIDWTRKIGCPCLFEANDLIELSRHPETEAPVLNCLMEVARGATFLPVLPQLVRFEQEMEAAEELVDENLEEAMDNFMEAMESEESESEEEPEPEPLPEPEPIVEEETVVEMESEVAAHDEEEVVEAEEVEEPVLPEPEPEPEIEYQEVEPEVEEFAEEVEPEPEFEPVAFEEEEEEV